MAEGVFQTSFAAGELSPNLYAREDIEKYSSGAALMRNFYVDYRGGASNRPGTEYKAQCVANTTTRLIPFIFSQDQSYVLEFSDAHIRIYQFGIAIQDLSAPWASADLFLLKYVQSADVMTIVHPDFPPYNLSRTSLTTFSLDVVLVGPTIARPQNLSVTASTAGNLRYGYVVTALTESGEESLPSLPDFAASAALDPTNATPKTVKQEWDKVDGARAYNVYKWGPVPQSEPMPTLFGYIGQTKATSFTDTNIAPDYSRVPPDFRDPFSPGQITDIDITSAGSGYSGYVALTITGDGTGAEAYAIADDTGAISAVVITSSGSDYTTATVTPTSGAATFDATIDTANHYPAVVTYFQQRRVYGGADASPELLEFSQVGAYENFDISPAVLDSDSITVNIASRQVNDIKALVPMSTGLIVFTTGCAFLVAGGQDNTVVTPSSVSAVPQASTGSNDIEPITVNYNILFVQQKGAIVRDMAFSFQTQSYYGVDRSMLANHLFFGYNIVDWAWAEEPYKLLWVVRNDGRCLVMTYVPDQEVYGWSQHDTNGLFKSVCTVPEGDQDATYFVVQRFIQHDQTWKNYFERLAFRTCDCPSDAAFLDSFVSVPRDLGTGSLTVTLSGDDATIEFSDSPGGGSVGTYLLEAKENYPTAIADYIDANIAFENATFSEQVYMPVMVDPVRRKFYWLGTIWEGFTESVTNTTGFHLWSGQNDLAPGDPYSQETDRTLYVFQKDMDTGAVTTFFTFDDTELVPNGIGGSDGTWRRRIAELAPTSNFPVMIDPWTGNLNFKTESCEIHQLLLAKDFVQDISPLFPVGDSLNPVDVQGYNSDWIFAYEPFSAGTGNQNSFYMIPRLRTAAETTADYLLNYLSFDFDSPFINPQRSVIARNGNLYMVLYTVDGGAPRVYLYKLVPPTLTGPPATGGSLTDISDWTSSTGPNADLTDYPSATWDKLNRFMPFTLPSQSAVAFITMLYPQDGGNGATDDFFRADITYMNTTTEVSTTVQGFVTTYMTAAWAPTTVLADAAYCIYTPSPVYEFNSFLDQASYDYTADITGLNYAHRWFWFMCLPVTAGVIGADPRIVMVEYDFSALGTPVVRQVVDEQPWDDAYTTYAAAIGADQVIANSLVITDGGATVTRDRGFYDVPTQAFWFSGGNTNTSFPGPANFWQLDAAFTPRAAVDYATPPLMRVVSGAVPPDTIIGKVLDIGCGAITITDGSGTTFTGLVEAPLTNIVTDDPFDTVIPVEEGDWYLTTPTNEIDASHLKGMIVGVFVNGLVLEQQTVPASGIVSWPESQATTRAVVGLPYQCQLKTMYLTTGEPTSQGRMKVISQVIIRVTCTLGIKAGPDFDQLVECKETMQMPYNVPPEHYQGDIQQNVPNDWNLYGQIAIQQDYPLPATILGVIPQVVIGDDD